MELDGLYASTRARIGATLTEAGPAADDVLVPACPDWTVAQLAAHLAGTTAALVAEDYPKGDTQAWVDAQVAARAGRSALECWEEWDAAGLAFERMLVANEAAFGSLLYDAIIHEDDINAALGRPCVKDPEGVAYGLQRGFSRLDREARRKGAGTLEVTCNGEVLTAGDGPPVVALTTTDGWELLRAIACRRSEAQLAAMGFGAGAAAWIALLPYDLPAADLHV